MDRNFHDFHRGEVYYVTEPAQPDAPDRDDVGEAEISQAGQAQRPWWLIVAAVLVVIVGIGVFFAVKKEKDEDSGQ